MDLKIISKSDNAKEVLKKLVKKKQRGILITGFVDDAGNYNAIFKFNKIVAGVMRGMSKYVLPQQEQFINDYLKKQGLTKKEYEVIIR